MNVVVQNLPGEALWNGTGWFYEFYSSVTSWQSNLKWYRVFLWILYLSNFLAKHFEMVQDVFMNFVAQ